MRQLAYDAALAGNPWSFMIKRIIAGLAMLVMVAGVIVILSNTAASTEHRHPRVRIGTALKVTRRADERQLLRRAIVHVRQHQLAVQREQVSRSERRQPLGCTSSNWRSTMTWQETWIDTRESGMDPTPSDVNPSSGARGLGELLPSTYASLGLTPDWDPCHELAAQRVYIHERYGTEDNAVAFWRSHNWY